MSASVSAQYVCLSVCTACLPQCLHNMSASVSTQHIKINSHFWAAPNKQCHCTPPVHFCCCFHLKAFELATFQFHGLELDIHHYEQFASVRMWLSQTKKATSNTVARVYSVSQLLVQSLTVFVQLPVCNCMHNVCAHIKNPKHWHPY